MKVDESSKPKNLGLVMEAIKADRDMISSFASDRERRKGKALLEACRNPEQRLQDDERLALDLVLSSLANHPDEVDTIRLAVLRAPEDVQGFLFTHGVLDGFAKDNGGGQTGLLRMLF